MLHENCMCPLSVDQVDRSVSGTIPCRLSFASRVWQTTLDIGLSPWDDKNPVP